MIALKWIIDSLSPDKMILRILGGLIVPMLYSAKHNQPSKQPHNTMGNTCTTSKDDARLLPKELAFQCARCALRRCCHPADQAEHDANQPIYTWKDKAHNVDWLVQHLTKEVRTYQLFLSDDAFYGRPIHLVFQGVTDAAGCARMAIAFNHAPKRYKKGWDRPIYGNLTPYPFKIVTEDETEQVYRTETVCVLSYNPPPPTTLKYL